MTQALGRALIACAGLAMAVTFAPPSARATTVDFADSEYGISGSFSFTAPIGTEIIGGYDSYLLFSTSNVTAFTLHVDGSTQTLGDLVYLDYRSGTNLLVGLDTSGYPPVAVFDDPTAPSNPGYDAGVNSFQSDNPSIYDFGNGDVELLPGGYDPDPGFQIGVVSTTPLPATWTMMLAALGFFGVVGRRVRRRAVAGA